MCSKEAFMPPGLGIDVDNIERPIRLFRTVDDFLAVSPNDIRACLRAFEIWLRDRQQLNSSPGRAALDPQQCPPDQFTWADQPGNEPCSTRVEQIGLQTPVVRELQALNLYTLEDFTETTEAELLATPRVGPCSVALIRRHLQAAGLSFKPPSSPGARAERPSSPSVPLLTGGSTDYE